MLCKGNARERDTSSIIQQILEAGEAARAFAWYEWVGTKANPADAPSRVAAGPLLQQIVYRAEMNQQGWTEIRLSEQPKSIWGV